MNKKRVIVKDLIRSRTLRQSDLALNDVACHDRSLQLSYCYYWKTAVLVVSSCCVFEYPSFSETFGDGSRCPEQKAIRLRSPKGCPFRCWVMTGSSLRTWSFDGDQVPKCQDPQDYCEDQWPPSYQWGITPLPIVADPTPGDNHYCPESIRFPNAPLLLQKIRVYRVEKTREPERLAGAVVRRYIRHCCRLKCMAGYPCVCDMCWVLKMRLKER
ncbi:hypothetical protein BX666DRAFT_1980923 [Dichotomocladium elegans]|nr:hypothetical protein BX666DRAFT_1980923 [Dichotomocladium elegans]